MSPPLGLPSRPSDVPDGQVFGLASAPVAWPLLSTLPDQRGQCLVWRSFSLTAAGAVPDSHRVPFPARRWGRFVSRCLSSGQVGQLLGTRSRGGRSSRPQDVGTAAL